MNRTVRFRLVCSVLSALLLVVGIRQLVEPVLTSMDPLLGTSQLSCTPCRIDTDPVRLLDRPLWKQGWQIEGVNQRIEQKLDEPRVQWLLIAATAAVALPLCLMFVSLGMAMRSFGRRGLASDAPRWLRLAALSALGWTLMVPVSRSLRAWALDSTISGVDSFRLPIDFYQLVTGVVIAGAALATVWALEEALIIQRDLDEYV